jgi:FlaA1/EpsC-like NDP-sugar epimerase
MTDPYAFTDLRERASRTMAIFGAGQGGRLAFRALAREGRVVAFVDNAERTWGTMVFGVRVISPRQLQTSWPDVVVVASQAVQPITEQLQALGLSQQRIQIFTPPADDLEAGRFQDLIEQIQFEITTLVGLAPDSGAPLRLVIFGAGAGGREAWARCRGRHRILGFADNDPAKIGTMLFGLPIMAPSALSSSTFDRIVIGSMHFDQICGQLIALGIRREAICSVDEVEVTA